MRTPVTLAILSLVLGRSASAEPTRPWQVDAGFGVQNDAAALIGTVQIFGGYFRNLAPLGADWCLFGAGGLYAARSTLSSEEPALDGATRLAVGPEFRLGFAKARGHTTWSTFYTYAALTPLVVTGRRAFPDLADDGGAFGYRAAYGLSLPGTLPFWFDVAVPGDGSDGSSGLGLLLLLMVLLPNTAEFNYEQIHGDDGVSRRIGFALGYSF